MTQESICGKCGSPVPRDADSCPVCFLSARKAEVIPVILVIVLLCSSFLMVGTSYVNVTSFSGDGSASSPTVTEMDFAAYSAAREFVAQRNPDAKTFSEFSRSSIEHVGNNYTVVLQVEELAANKPPARAFYSVELELAGGNWKLKEIRQ
jgi:hypothetical protein